MNSTQRQMLEDENLHTITFYKIAEKSFSYANSSERPMPRHENRSEPLRVKGLIELHAVKNINGWSTSVCVAKVRQSFVTKPVWNYMLTISDAHDCQSLIGQVVLHCFIISRPNLIVQVILQQSTKYRSVLQCCICFITPEKNVTHEF